MDIFQSSKIALFCSTLVVLWWAWKILNWAWFRPKKLEKILKRQGLNGNSYRPLFGDTKEMSMLLQESKSKPIDLTNDIVPRIMPFIYKTIEQKGKNSFMWIGPTPVLLLLEPEHVKEILTKTYTYHKAPGNPLARLLAQGLATTEMEKWAKHRRLLNPAFHVEKFNLTLPAIQLSCDEMLREWEKVGLADGSCELDVWPYLKKLTGDIISRTALGSNYVEGRKIFELQIEQIQHFEQVVHSIYLPGWRFVPTRRNKRMKRIDKEVQSMLLGIINNRVQEIEGRQPRNYDLLDILLESNFNEIQKHGNKKSGMSLDDIIEECKLFYLAGQETNADLLVWTLILLSKHSDWQARARDEVLQVFGNNMPNIDGLNHLKVVTMILNEVLRLFPPAVMLVRSAHEETKLGELSIPAGVMLFLLPIMLQRDQEIWGDDAKEFKPERFSEGVSKATKGSHFSFFPFSWGPRICFGQNFAMLQAKIALASILQRFSFQLSPGYAHSPQINLTLQPQHGA